MKKNKTSLKNAQAALEIAGKNYEAKLRESSELEQKAHKAQMSGDAATAEQIMGQAIEVDAQLSQLKTEIKDLEQIINDSPKRNNLTPLLLLIPLALILAGGGYWLYARNQPPSTQVACLPSGTKLRINGSTSMVNVNQKLKQLIEAKCSGTSIETAANGSDIGIEQVLDGKVDIAAVSRPLNSQEQAKDLVATYVKGDAIPRSGCQGHRSGSW